MHTLSPAPGATPRVLRLASFLLLAAASLAQAQYNVTKIRFLPAEGREASMVGGVFTGSNTGRTLAFSPLARIETAPASGQWTEIALDNQTVYRWIKYEAPDGSGGAVAEVEFYSGSTKIAGTAFGTNGSVLPDGGSDFAKALDGNPSTYFLSTVADGQYVGLELPSAAQVATPSLSPGGGLHTTAPNVRLSVSTAGATIRYTLDQTLPSETHGILIANNGTVSVQDGDVLVAVAYREGLATSQLAVAPYRILAQVPPMVRSWHGGNSLTDTIDGYLEPIVRSAARNYTFHRYTIPGAPTDWNWNNPTGGFGGDFRVTFDQNVLDHMSTQPFGGHGRSIANEAFYGLRFFQRARYHYPENGVVEGVVDGRTVYRFSVTRDDGLPRARSPNVQPWLYLQWPSQNLGDSPAKGTGPISAFGLWPASTLAEGISNQLFWIERIRDEANALIAASEPLSFNPSSTERHVVELLPGTLPVKIVPGGVVLAQVFEAIKAGPIPGMVPEEFFSRHFSDGVHLAPAGRYAVSLAFYAAFFGESPEGRVLSALGRLTPEQAAHYQRIAWEAVRNYPFAGIYQRGTVPVAPPQPTIATGPLSAPTLLTFSSDTPGAWFRYTTDGSTPTDEHGLLFMGAFHVRAGMQIRVVAFKDGYAPSEVIEASYSFGQSDRLLLRESFSSPPGPLLQAADFSPGWAASQWQQTTASATGAFSIASGSLAYRNLITSGGHLQAGNTGHNAGREFDRNAVSSPFLDYLRADQITWQGRPLWLSAILQKNEADPNTVFLSASNNAGASSSNPRFALGYFGSSSDSSGVRYWSLRLGGSTVHRSGVPIVPGEPALLVLRVDPASNPPTYTLWVNPTQIGGEPPAAAGVGGTLSGSLALRNLVFTTGSAAAGSLDEIRLGESYAAVTAAPPEAVSAGSASSEVFATRILWQPAYAAADYLIARADSAHGPFTLLPNGVSDPGFLDQTAPIGSPVHYRIWSRNQYGLSPEPFQVGPVSAFTPYDYWRAQAFTPEQISAGLADPLATPFGDGVPNLLKMAFGLPLIPSLPIQGLPSLDLDPAQNLFTFRFRRDSPHLTYRVLSSTNLRDWDLLVTDPGLPGTEVVLPMPLGHGPIFLRLEVSE